MIENYFAFVIFIIIIIIAIIMFIDNQISIYKNEKLIMNGSKWFALDTDIESNFDNYYCIVETVITHHPKKIMVSEFNANNSFMKHNEYNVHDFFNTYKYKV